MAKIVEDYVVPVVHVQEDDVGLRVASLHGTAFFINSKGFFITASHVISDAVKAAETEGGKVALSMRRPGEPKHNYHGYIEALDHAEPPYDIAIGRIVQPSKSCFTPIEHEQLWVWQDVYAVGYAESAVSRDGTRVRQDTRALKGHVVRKVPAGEYLAKVGPHPAAFEVNFAIPRCMSGSPVVLRYQEGEQPPPGAPFRLVGLCIGNETVCIGEETEIYGVVHVLTPLLSWKPECLAGMTLNEAIRPEG